MPNKNFEEKFIIYPLLDNKQFLILLRDTRGG